MTDRLNTASLCSLLDSHPAQLMPLFKKKPETIPPVSPSADYRSVKSNASTYIRSRDGDPYNPGSTVTSSTYNDPPSDPYGRNKAIGDVYSRSGAELDKDRSELFAGYNPSKSGSGRFFDGPNLGGEPAPGEENDEDVEGIKQQTRFVKQESVTYTRNALRMAREAEETARNTIIRLGDQSGNDSIFFSWSSFYDIVNQKNWPILSDTSISPRHIICPPRIRLMNLSNSIDQSFDL